MLKRALGCLYGQLIGDALGCRYEFSDARRTEMMLKMDSEPDGFLPILGGGPFNMSPGQVLDFTSFSLKLFY